MRLSGGDRWLYPISTPPLVTDEPEEEISIDKWDNPLMRLAPTVPPARAQPPPLAALDEPIPDPPLLPERIPWDTPLSYEFRSPRRTMTPIGVFVTLDTEEEPFLDKWDPGPTRIVPWRPTMPIALFEFNQEPEDTEPENITIDKWDPGPVRIVPWRPIMPVSLMPFEQKREDDEPEPITLDKWYSNTAFWSWPFYALRAVTGAEAQRVDLLVNTAPWIPMERRDPFPRPDIEGVTAVWWMRPMDLPRKLFTPRERDDEEHLRLYLPLQDFPIEPDLAPECERPRRRVVARTGDCGSGVQ